MIALDKVTVRFGGVELLSEISLMVNPRERIGLVGRNGAGKTTILRLFMGIMAPSEGSVSVQKEIRLGYLPQQMNHTDSTSVFHEAEKAFDEVLKLEKEIARLNQKLQEREDYESDSYHQIIHRLTEASDRYEILGGSNREAEIEKSLFGLGFERKDLGRQTAEFSGGWRMRIELAKILLEKPDVLLLDEPTNHLDIESIQWLEDYLSEFRGSVILISHDRTFLDRVTSRTVEITLGRLYDYRVPYSQFLELRAERREQQLAAYQNQQKMINDTEKFIERFRYKASKAVQVQSRIRQLEKIDRIEIEEIDGRRIHIKFPPAPHSGNLVVEVIHATKSYGNLTVLKDVDFVIEKGEKIAFIGRNGEGKTTLARILMGETDFQGTCRIGQGVRIGYYAQNQAELLDPGRTVLETVDYHAIGEVRTRMRDILGAFLFGGEDIDKKVSVLSGGERARLALACMLLEPRNLLILDEPTNHLDLRSKQILKEALMKYDGTLILVSHDRDFLDGLVGRIFEFRHQKIREHDGNIFEFLQRKKLDHLKEIERRDKVRSPQQKRNESDNKAQFLARKDWEKKRRLVESQVERLESEISNLEQRIRFHEAILANPQLMESPAGADPYAEYENLSKELADKMKDWEDAHRKLDEFADPA